jgi:hypothetical protein
MRAALALGLETDPFASLIIINFCLEPHGFTLLRRPPHGPGQFSTNQIVPLARRDMR